MAAVQRNSFPPNLFSSGLQLTDLIWLDMNLAGEKGKKNIPTVKYIENPREKKASLKVQGATVWKSILRKYWFVCPVFTPFPRNLLMATGILN